MLSQIDLQRLNKVKEDVASLGLRFPVATIAKRTGRDKGYVSSILGGKVPCSDNFINRFYVSFQEELDKARCSREIGVALDAPLDTIRSEKLRAIASTLAELAAIINQIA